MWRSELVKEKLHHLYSFLVNNFIESVVNRMNRKLKRIITRRYGTRARLWIKKLFCLLPLFLRPSIFNLRRDLNAASSWSPIKVIVCWMRLLFTLRICKQLPRTWLFSLNLSSLLDSNFFPLKTSRIFKIWTMHLKASFQLSGRQRTDKRSLKDET